MKIFCKFPTVNISKLNFWLVICIAKNFIWTTLKAIFSIFDFFAPSDSRFSNSCISAKYYNKPYINGKLIYSAFRWCINLSFEKLTLMTGLWSRVTYKKNMQVYFDTGLIYGPEYHSNFKAVKKNCLAITQNTLATTYQYHNHRTP